MTPSTPTGDRPRVLILGGGFGGLEVARHLAGRPVDITVVDRHNFHTFQPLLYQVATARPNAGRRCPPATRPLPRPANAKGY